MRRPEFIARQARCPSGVLGTVIARVMAIETTADNARAIELLAPQRLDHVLEIGFAHGRSIVRLANLANDGFVVGVEISERMLVMASRFNRRLIQRGQVELKLGDGANIPYDDGSFDKVLSVHTLYFWPDARDTLTEIHRVMRPGGRLVIGFQPGEDPEIMREFPASTYRFYRCDEVQALFEQAAFDEIRLVRSDDAPRKVVFAVARG